MGRPSLSHVFQPGAIGTLRLPHRIVMGAMHLGIEARQDGGQAIAAFYAERARGEAGLIITGGAAVNEVGAGGVNYSILTDATHRSSLARIVSQVHDAGAMVALQLFHAGRYAPPTHGRRPVAPSPVFSRFSGCVPEALTIAEIGQTLRDFADGAGLARALGFDAVEIMASEGYLIDQFLSPLTNQRDDEWGGTPARRMRFGLEVLRHVRASVGSDFPIIYRFSGADLMDGGTSEDEALTFARALAAHGADALSVGIGWHESPVPTVQALVPPGAWTHVAAAVKDAVGALPVIAGNRINRLSLAESILATTSIDFISMARPFLADPGIIARGHRGERVNICIACNQACIDRSLADTNVSCMVNPRAGRESELPSLVPRAATLRTAVIGGGPAGLQAARELATTGHRVDLYDAAGQLGGQFCLACQVPGKEDYAETIRYYTSELDRLGVTIYRGRPLGEGDEALVRGYDGVIVATGTRPRKISIPGAGLPHVIPYPQAFSAGALGEHVVIIGGGGTAIDLAHLASKSSGRRTVTILHRGKRIGARIGRSTRWALLSALRTEGVQIQRTISYQRIESRGIRILDVDGSRLVPADTVVIAAGQETDPVVPALVKRCGAYYRLAGGARDVADLDAVRAFAEGLAAAREISADARHER